MKIVYLLLLGCFLQSETIFAAERVSVSDIKITFAKIPVKPSSDLLKKANRAGIGPDPDAAKGGSSAVQFGIVADPDDHGAFTNLVAGRISALNVTWANLQFTKDESQTRDFLRQLLSITNSHTYTFHIWSWTEGEPDVVATVEHTEGKQGKWFIWCSPGLTCAYLDGNGRWWWASWPHVVPERYAVNLNTIPWGGAIAGLQMASELDKPNGVIHCCVRNGETNHVSFNDFDFGYWEFVGLEIRDGTNWVNLPRTRPGIACGGCHAAGIIRELKPNQVITGTNWLRYEINPEHAGFIPTTDGIGWRSKLPASWFYDDTFTLDLMAFKYPPGHHPPGPLEARVRQTFYPVSADEKQVTLYSPVFTLDNSALQFLYSEAHDAK